MVVYLFVLLSKKAKVEEGNLYHLKKKDKVELPVVGLSLLTAFLRLIEIGVLISKSEMKIVVYFYVHQLSYITNRFTVNPGCSSNHICLW